MGHAARYNAPRTVEAILADPKTYVPRFLAWKMRHPKSAVALHVLMIPIDVVYGAYVGICGSANTIKIYVQIARDSNTRIF